MSERFNQLVANHGRLRAQIAVQRSHLAQQASDIQERLSVVDRGVGAVRRVVRNPLLIVGGVALIAWVGPKRLVQWASRSAIFYSSAKRVVQLMRPSP